MLEVLREVDGRHSTRAELALEAVAVCEGNLKPWKELGHVSLTLGAARWPGLGDRPINVQMDSTQPGVVAANSSIWRAAVCKVHHPRCPNPAAGDTNSHGWLQVAGI